MSNFFVRVSRRITGNTIYFQTDINRVPLVTLKDKTGADASDKIAFRWQIIFFFYLYYCQYCHSRGALTSVSTKYAIVLRFFLSTVPVESSYFFAFLMKCLNFLRIFMVSVHLRYFFFYIYIHIYINAHVVHT